MRGQFRESSFPEKMKPTKSLAMCFLGEVRSTKSTWLENRCGREHGKRRILIVSFWGRRMADYFHSDFFSSRSSSCLILIFVHSKCSHIHYDNLAIINESCAVMCKPCLSHYRSISCSIVMFIH